MTRCSGFQYSTIHKAPPLGRKYRSESLDDNPFILGSSSSSTSSSEAQQMHANDLPKAHVYALPAVRFWKELKTNGVLNDDTTSKALINMPNLPML